jgi:hypothetical protein
VTDLSQLDKAIQYVRQNGNPLDRLRLRNALGEPFALAEAEETLTRWQFPDGSWDYEPRDAPGDGVGSLGGTIHCLRWVREFGLGDTQLAARTIGFLESIESPDGSFYETEAKLAHSPQSWLQEETLIDRFYFTAAVPVRLFSLGYTQETVIEPAIRWLEQHWADWELVTGTWYNLWALLCLYPQIDRLSQSQYQRCHARALEWLPNLEAQQLTWLLDALQGAGYSEDEPLVQQGLARLLNLEGASGLWADEKYSTVETTITALRLLLDYGSIPLDPLSASGGGLP